MRRAIPFFFLLLVSATAFAQTNIAGGLVSGTWTAAGSPYLVQGNIMIANGSALTIQPGVTVSFQGSYRLLVNGRLSAAGTAADSIRFTAANITTGWQGIRFDNTSSNNDSSVISYCSIQYGIVTSINGGGIYVRNFSKLRITNSSISNCWVVNAPAGGGIYLEGSNALISGNKIAYNHAETGGGIRISGGSPVVTNNELSYNDNQQPEPVGPGPGGPGAGPDSYGGGISLWFTNGATVSNNIISHNKSGTGGGLHQEGGSVAITNNTISSNQASMGGGVYARGGGIYTGNRINDNSASTGGGVYCEDNSQFRNNVVINNAASRAGGGFMFSWGVSLVFHNLVANNTLTEAPASFLEGGGGICVNGGATSVLLESNIIVNNTGINGGGLFFYGGSETMVNNTVANNSAQRGGALYCVDATSVDLLNTILWGNTASAAGQQIFLSDDASDPSIRYSDVMGGQGGIDANGNFYTGVYEDNMDMDPLFASPSAGSGHLFDGVTAGWVLSGTSPAIDAGEPNRTYTPNDYAGNIRVVNGRIDMGAIEDQTTVPPTAAVSGGGTVCQGVTRPSVLFTFTPGTFPFTLVYSVNGVAQTPITGINTLEYSISNAAPGTYAVVSISDPFTTGTASGTATVTVEQPLADFSINRSPQCLAGNHFVFTDASMLNAGSFIAGWSWNFGDDSTSTIANPSHIYNNTGNYSVRLIIHTLTGCSDTVTKVVSVQAFTINPLQDTVRTFLDSLPLNAGNGYARYLWSNGDTTQTAIVKSTGTYKVTVTNGLGCTAGDSSYVEFRKRKTLFIDKVQDLCTVSSVSLSVRAKSLTNIIGLQGTIRWNQLTMTLDSVTYANTAISITEANVNLNIVNGYLTYSWNDNTLTGKTVADSTGLFTLWFTKPTASNAQSQPVSFSSNPTMLEIDSINLSNNTPVLVTETNYINGSAGFRGQATAAGLQVADCDSVIYNNQVYFQNAQLFDTVKYAGSACDSVIKNVIITVYDTIVYPAINISASSTNIVNGSAVTFTALISFGGSNPLIQWYRNGTLIPGATGGQYSTNTLSGRDTIHAVLRSSFRCANDSAVVSNRLVINVRYNISGNIRGPLGASTRQPSVAITGFSNSTVATAGNGAYSALLSGGPAYNYVLKPFKTNDLNRTNGVSTLDIAIIQSHILSASLFTSPYQWIAADVNRSGSVTSLDILLIRRLILALNTGFSGNSVWTFVDTANGGLDTFAPLQYRDSVVLTNLLADRSNLNFIAVKLGDVNFDYNNTLARPTLPATKPVTFYYDDVLAGKEETIRIPVRVKDFKNVLAMQYTVGFNAAALEFAGVENNRLNMSFASNHSSEGKLSFIWNDTYNTLVTLNDGDTLVELLFKTTQLFTEEDISINSDITTAELWDGDHKKHLLVKGAGKIISKRTLHFMAESFDVMPNPSNGPVQLQLRLLTHKNIRIELLDKEGRVCFVQVANGIRGINNINIDLEKQQTLASGIYYLRLTGINGTVESKKIVLIR